MAFLKSQDPSVIQIKSIFARMNFGTIQITDFNQESNISFSNPTSDSRIEENQLSESSRSSFSEKCSG